MCFIQIQLWFIYLVAITILHAGFAGLEAIYLIKSVTCIIHGYLHNLYLHCMASLQRLTVRNQGHIMYDGWSYWRRESNMLLSMRITISSATRSSEVYTLPFDDFTSHPANQEVYIYLRVVFKYCNSQGQTADCMHKRITIIYTMKSCMNMIRNAFIRIIMTLYTVHMH